MFKYYVNKIETNTGKHIKVYKLNMPDYNEKDFYRQTTSFSSFFHNLKKRNYNKNILYHVKSETDWIEDNDHWMKTYIKNGMDADSIDQRKLPFTEHNGIWDFYKEIGFDYRKKRYTKI